MDTQNEVANRYMLIGENVSAWLFEHRDGSLTLVWRADQHRVTVTKTRFFQRHEDAAQFFDDLDAVH